MAEQQKAIVTKLRDVVERQRNRLTRVGDALNEASPLNTAVHDISGVVVGIAASWGLDYTVSKVGSETMAERSWKKALTNAGAGTAAYALSLAVPYDRPISPMRRALSIAALTTMGIGVKATAEKAKASYMASREKQARAQFAAVAAAQRAQIEAEQAAKK